MKTVTSTEAPARRPQHGGPSTEVKARLNALMGEVPRAGEPFTITNRGRASVVVRPAVPLSRRFGLLAGLSVPEDFDGPLPESELAAWEGGDVE